MALLVATVGERCAPRPADAVVVLGTQEYSVWPSRSFAARLDNAFSLYEEGLAPLVVIAGGDPEGDSYTEAAAGVRYLEHQGLPSDALLAATKVQRRVEQGLAQTDHCLADAMS